MSEILALIPARGGSKGIPRKNLRSVYGKPLIVYTIQDALACGHITRTVVSTDDPEIAQVALAAGAEVPFLRPAKLAQDRTPDLPVFQHAMRWLKEQQGYEPDLVVHLRPTCPVRNVETIAAAIDALEAHQEATALRSVSWPVQTPYKMWRIVDGYLKPLLELDGVPEPYSQPRQMLPELFWQNGYVDVIRSQTILTRHSMTGPRVLPFRIQEPCVEIDYEESLHVAERLMKVRDEGQVLPQPMVQRHPA